MKNNSHILKNKDKGFSLLEIVVSITIFSLILLAVISFLLTMNTSSLRTKADREVSENARRALEEITYEIRSAMGIYTPTTTAGQLSLETSKYFPDGESDSFIDFFLCELPSGQSAVCLKKESQEPIALTADSVDVSSLVFSQISTDSNPSVQVSLTVNYVDQQNFSTISLTSVASLRSY